MMRFSKILSITIFMMILGQALFAQEQKNGLTWYTNIEQVRELSGKTKKPVFAFFTGSDWCGWCHRLEANVFDKPGFQAWAKKNVILLELDYPRNKKLPDELAKQNDELQRFFKIEHFPTIWIFNIAKDKADGKKVNITALGSLGYPRSDPGKEEVTFLDDANRVLNNKK